jgi:hypothetical protein
MNEIKQNIVTIEKDYNGVVKTHVIKHFGRINPIDQIDANQFDQEYFLSNYFKQNKPLVIRNYLSKFDCGTAYQNWTLDYLANKCGNNKVHVRRNTVAEDYKTGKAYFAQEATFKSYIDDLIQENKRSKNSYLAVQNLKKAFPQIADEIKLEPLIFHQKLHAGPFLWIARSGHYEYTHQDPDDNALIVLKGQKLVRLYGCNVYSMKPNELGSKGRTIQSQIDCDKDYDQLDLSEDEFEKFKNTECNYCLLEAGDILYFPAFWWHQVKSPELTISINIFFGNEGENNYIEKILNSPQRVSLLYWVYNLIEQNKPQPGFPRVLFYLKDSFKYFLYKQWHEHLSKYIYIYIFRNGLFHSTQKIL